jgi:drug/metabolite transporter (DMT)-like permease
VLGAALAGPTLGVACYQAALRTEPAALVQAVIAALPVTIWPLTWIADGDRPGWRPVLASAVAVGLVVALVLAR